MTPLSASDRRRLPSVARRIEAWLPHSGRMFPWRERYASIYEQICVEVLVQRTKAETVANSYRSFFAKFPNWNSLACAPTTAIEEELKPLGLWRRRAIGLKRLASFASSTDGRFPNSREELEKLPAVGQYVASAILLFQHQQPEPLIDTNTSRVLERYFRPRVLADIRHDPWLQASARKLVSAGNAKAINWAILDLGAKICRPAKPLCSYCPLKRGCSFAAMNNHAPPNRRRA